MGGAGVAAGLPGRIGPAAILRRHPAGQREVPSAASAPADGDAPRRTLPEREVDEVPDGVRLEDGPAAVAVHGTKADRDRLKAKQLRVARLVKVVLSPCVLLGLSAHLVDIQNLF